MELMDFGHLDLSLKVVKSLHETYGERFLPPQALINLVNAGHLGRRSGRGWYVYDKGK
jgi:3-hydroxybutyryl-CoA dehydrogenase